MSSTLYITVTMLLIAKHILLLKCEHMSIHEETQSACTHTCPRIIVHVQYQLHCSMEVQFISNMITCIQVHVNNYKLILITIIRMDNVVNQYIHVYIVQ